jgi:hypothetical protein
MRVKRIEQHKDPLLALGNILDLPYDVGVDRRALYEVDTASHWMSIDRPAIMCANVDVDSDHLSGRPRGIKGSSGFDGFGDIQEGKHGCAEDKRPSVSDACLDDKVWFDRPDQLLDDLNILRKLDYRAAEPGKFVRVAIFRSIKDSAIG